MLSSRNGNLFYKYNGFFKGMVENNHIIKVDLAHAKRIRIPYTQNYHHLHLGYMWPGELDV